MKGCLVDFICFTYFYSFTRFHTLNSSWQLSRNLGHAASSECGSANLLHRRPLPWQLCHAGPCSCIRFNAKKNASDGFLEATFSIPSAQMRTRTASHRMGEDHPIWTMQGLQYFPRILGTSSMLHDFSAKKSVLHPYFLLKDHSKKKGRKPSAIGKNQVISPPWVWSLKRYLPVAPFPEPTESLAK